MKRRSFFGLLAAAVVVLLLMGIGGYYWLVAQSPLALLKGGSQKTPTAAIFVSKQAPVMVSILVNPDRLEALRQLVTPPGERRLRRQEIKALKTNLLANTGLDYQRDIQPWLGDEITLAVTAPDIDRDPENGRQPGYLMVLTTENPERSREFLQLLFSRRTVAGTELGYEAYKGVKLIYENQPPARAGLFNSSAGKAKLSKNPPVLGAGLAENSVGKAKLLKNPPLLTGAVVGDRFVVLANHPNVLREAINNVQAPDLNLTSSSQYQQTLSLLPPRRIGVTFLNFDSSLLWQGSKPESQTYQSQIIALELKRQGLLTETALIAAPEREISPPAPTLSQVAKALKYMPSTTGLAISGSDLSQLENTDLNQLWTEVSAGSSGSGYDALSRLVKQPLANLQQRWGIDLQRDIFSWVKGEYALGLLSDRDRTTPDWIFVAEKSDNSETGISHLDAIASARGLNITPLSVGNQQVFAWTELNTDPTSSDTSNPTALTFQAKVQGVHTTAGNYEIFTTSIEAMEQALKASQKRSVVDNPNFQAGIKAIPQPNKGYVYLDWTASQKLLERQLPILQLLEIAGKPFFSNLRSLTISSYPSEEGVLKGGIFFRF